MKRTVLSNQILNFNLTLLCPSNLVSFEKMKLFMRSVQWQSYTKELWSESSVKFDTVITDHFSALSSNCHCFTHHARLDECKIETDEVCGFPLFCKKVLRNGGYAVVIEEICIVSEWMEAFKKAGFMIMSYSYGLVYSPSIVSNCSLGVSKKKHCNLQNSCTDSGDSSTQVFCNSRSKNA